jgi:hypothetical protein
VLAEQHDEWTEGRRYLSLDVLTRARTRTHTDPAAAELARTEHRGMTPTPPHAWIPRPNERAALNAALHPTRA